MLLRQYGGKRHQRSVKAVKATRDKRPGGYVVKIVSGSILTKMMGSRQTWLRFALVLAVSLATWADAALEAFVCPHLSGCPHEIAGNVRTSLSNTAVSEHARHSNLHRMPCCPQPAQASWQCDMAMRDCCAGKHREPHPAALQDASKHRGPDQAVLVSSAGVAELPSLAVDRSTHSSSEDPPSIKPVNQKKTDLRI